MNGVILYEGPSLLDGAPIVAIATGLDGSSANAKTGAMVQTWILRAELHPMAALQNGGDASVCGDCKHRPANHGACYVNVGQAPSAVWRGFKVGRYPKAQTREAIVSAGAGKPVRLGSYGDPAAVPPEIWRAFVERAAMHTGYTHQWQTAPALRHWCMASADSQAELESARAMGWRTFRVRTEEENLSERESACPASEEAGYKATCAQCGACNGTATGRRGSIAIIVHGAKAKRFRQAA